MRETDHGKPVALPGNIVAAAAILDRSSDSVRAVMGSEANRFTRALDHLRRLSHKESISIAVVGSLAAIRYGYHVGTQNIDIVVARSQIPDLLQAAPKFGLNVTREANSGWHTLTHGDVEINVVPEGGKARNSAPTTIPGPHKLGVKQGLDYAALPGWIELKISSARQKDRAHVVEVMKRASSKSVQAARDHIAKTHQSYLTIFDQLWEEAQEERRQEDERGGKDTGRASS